jgi:asparagine synthase (glutamine-hydrolysing)
VLDRHREVYDDNQLDDVVSRMCLADTRMFMPGLNLTYTDRASMAASTEVSCAVRRPGRDGRGVLAARHREDPRTPPEGSPQGCRAGLAPEGDRRPPKASFGAPLRAWVTNDLRELVDDVLLRGELVDIGFLRAAPLQRLVDDQRSGRRDEAKQVWQLLSLELWYRNARAAGVGAS